jgi:hypothetical protein
MGKTEGGNMAIQQSDPFPRRIRCGFLAVGAFALFALVFVMGCERAPTGPSQVVQINGLTATVIGEFRTRGSNIQIEFRDADGQLVEVGTVRLELSMPMPGMMMQTGAIARGKEGIYTARLQPEMAGRWFARLSYSGPQGSGETSFPINVR